MKNYPVIILLLVWLALAPIGAQSVCVVGSGAPSVAVYALDANGKMVPISIGGIGWGRVIPERSLTARQSPQCYLLSSSTWTGATETWPYAAYYLRTFGHNFKP